MLFDGLSTLVGIMASREVTAREQGLALISRINRWLIAGAVGVAGLLSLVAAHAFHGHSANASPAARTAAPQSQPQSQPSGDDSGGGLQQPAQAPAPAPAAPAPVVSGGS